MMKDFNLNSTVAIKLSKKGLKCVVDYYDKYSIRGTREQIEFGLGTCSNMDDGIIYHTFPMHEFMDIFSEISSISYHEYFDLNIKIDLVEYEINGIFVQAIK